MDQPPPYVTAIHEAGHAIMAAACGFKNVRIELSEEEDSLGRIRFDPEPPSSENYHLRHALVALAGMISERIITGVEPTLDHVAKDLGCAQTQLTALPAHTMNTLFAKTYSYLRHDLPFGLIEEVAMSAMITGGLSAEAFSEYLARIPPIDLG